MKRMITSNTSEPVVIDVEIFADHPLLHLDLDDPEVVASVDLTKYSFPDRPVISKDKARVVQWMVDDFESFMENVEWLCEEDLNLVGVYRNVSDDHSYYYNYLAKDENGKIIAKFRLRLRISNHLPKRSKSQRQNKKAELDSEKLHELLSEQDISKLTTYAKVIIVNDEKYDSYEEAFDDVKSILEHAVEVMLL